MDAREAALITLYEVFYEDAYSNLALKSMQEKCGAFDRRERALLTGLVHGVISRKYTLDHVIGCYSSVKVKKLAKYIRIILELGLYQLMYMDKIPESAAVNESVKLAKRYGRRGADRFVNGVLRSFCRSREYSLPETEPEKAAVELSYPPELISLFVKDYGEERARSIMRSLNEPARLTLRANALKCSGDELVKLLSNEGQSAERGEGTLVYSSGFDVAASELYRRGYFSVQDKGAYMAAVSLDPQPGETVIDMCAAPGGKSTHIAELQKDSGKVIACDIYPHKLGLIDDAAKRLGIKTIKTLLSDGTKTREELIGTADRVLCDVPCSGTGIIRRKPDIKLCRTDISELPPIQSVVLENGAKYLKSGGVIVYSTCTLLKRENEEITASFLERNGGFERIFENTYFPDTDGSDGFYICKMRKK